MATNPERSPILKSLVITSSLILVGGYVAYSVADDIMPSSKSGRIVGTQKGGMITTSPSTAPSAGTADEPTTRRAKFFPGSKSAPVFEPKSADDRQIEELTSPATRPTTEPVIIR